MDLEDNTGKFSIKMHGSEVGVFLMSRGEYELSRHMKAPPVLDTGDLLLSPMPGTLISYAVEEGDRVEAGQEICVVEAMKMQNLPGRNGTRLARMLQYSRTDSVLSGRSCKPLWTCGIITKNKNR